MTQQEVEKLRASNQTINRMIAVKTAAQMLQLSEPKWLRVASSIRQEIRLTDASPDCIA